MSGNSRIISGEVAHGGKRGKALIKELHARFDGEQNVGTKSSKKKNYA